MTTVMRMTLTALLLGGLLFPAGALTVTMKDGSAVDGEIQGTIHLSTAYGAVELPGGQVTGARWGERVTISMADGSVLVGTVSDKSIRVLSGGERVELPTAGIASISGSTAKAPEVVEVGGLRFVRLAGGTFTMGSPVREGEADENPAHEVTVSPFAMAMYEITLAQFRRFVADTGYKPRAGWGGEGAEFPVANVSWKDAAAYCAWFSSANGVEVRLPTEVEWEYAARGGLRGRRYPNGDTISHADANFESKHAGRVGRYPSNGFGLYDMAGNVWEWCLDWYDARYYGSSPRHNPTGPSTGSSRVYRGGGFLNHASSLRVANRSKNLPVTGITQLGFRPVLVSPRPVIRTRR